jgi:S-formylglutathione hydrolase FrmB
MKMLILCLAVIALSAGFAGAQGTVISESFYAASLDRDQDLRIYLPEGYDPSLDGGYPVVYWLHGANSHANDPNYNFIFEVLDALISGNDPSAVIQPLVLVMPNGAASPYAGSMWVNSDLYGQFEDYVIDDVAMHVEASYNVRSDRAGRAISGYSMGGMGSMGLALKHPDHYCGVASVSGALDFVGIQTAIFAPMLQELGGQPPYVYNPAAGLFSYLSFTAAGGYSPNLDNPPYYVDIPLDSEGELLPEVFDRWLLHDPVTLAAGVAPGAVEIYFNCGTADDLNFYPLNEQFAAVLTGLGHPFVFETDGGGHGGPELLERVRSAMLFLDSCFLDVVSVQPGQEPQSLPATPTTRLLASAPNPFNPAVEIRFELAEPQPVTLTIHDLAGRRIATLRTGWCAAGRHAVVWHGTDGTGQAVASGTYIARLQGAQRIDQQKLQLVR